MAMPVLRRIIAVSVTAVVVASLAWAAPAMAGPSVTAAPSAPAAPAVSTVTTGSSILTAPTDCANLPARAATLARTSGPGTATCVRENGRAAPTRSTSERAGVMSTPCGSNSWIATRTTICGEESFQLVVFTVPQGVIVGTIDYGVRVEVMLSGRSDRWDTYVRFTGYRGAGAIAGTTLNAVPLCGQMCSYLSSPGITTLFGPGSVVPGAASFSSQYGGPYVSWQSSASWQFTFSNPAWTPPISNSLSITPPAHRCDDALPGRPVGCTVAFVEPTHTISSLAHPTYARHIGLALNFGLPSRLTRTTDGTRNESNRRIACTDPQGRPRPAGFSCDEYPFASTYEGAASHAYGRTFFILGGINGGGQGFSCQVPWLQPRRQGDSGGYSACMIPDWENTDAGSLLGLFYYDNRVIDRDMFRIRLV
ncbi:hypothetical protein E0H26_13610 [Micromonospora zingiberis]|uniref:Deoxyribonuclease NucA/NucB domain-containing protein n=1 Tax=Micromonospora zingiberis TaxID=2053011 RepID=A0A4R0GP80_9ACTN|nr:hypothetical protein [Micromonospora zingiberis]TCB97288.1 hypothetical protein E0H26_13610 [Micromonospora zingiberis]